MCVSESANFFQIARSENFGGATVPMVADDNRMAHMADLRACLRNHFACFQRVAMAAGLSNLLRISVPLFWTAFLVQTFVAQELRGAVAGVEHVVVIGCDGMGSIA